VEAFWVGLAFQFGEAVGRGSLLRLVFGWVELDWNRVDLGPDLLVDAGQCGGPPGSAV